MNKALLQLAASESAAEPMVLRVETPPQFRVEIQGQKFSLTLAEASALELGLRRSLTHRDGGRQAAVIHLLAEKVCRLVAEEFGVSSGAMRGPRRTQPVADARAVAMSLLYTDAANPQTTVAIGEWFKRDHGTVCWNCRKVEDRMSTAPDFRARVQRLRAKLSSPLQNT